MYVNMYIYIYTHIQNIYVRVCQPACLRSCSTLVLGQAHVSRQASNHPKGELTRRASTAHLEKHDSGEETEFPD